MRLYIDNSNVALDKVAVRELGFGETPRGLVVSSYRVILSRDEISRAFGAEFDRFVIDCAADAAAVGDEPLAGGLLGGMMFDEALSMNEAVVAEIIRRYLSMEVLLSLFSDSRSERPEYVLNSLDSVKFEDCEVQLDGTAFSAKCCNIP